MSGATVSLDDFFDHVRDSSPFALNRITDPSQADIHVSSIHQAEFERLTAHARNACRTPQGVGVMVFGEAGIGKSHLVARVCRWADEEGAFYVFLHNLQSNPERIPRYILKCILNRLTKGKEKGYHSTPLFKLIHKTLQPYFKESGKSLQWQDVLAAYRREITLIMDTDGHSSSPYDQSVYDVIFRFFVSAVLAAKAKTSTKKEEEKAKLALAWLAGDFIDNADAKLLGLSPQPDAEDVFSLEDDEAVTRVIVALAHFAGKHQVPLILFLDQVDNMKEEQFKSLSMFVHGLVDNTANLLVVTSGVQSTLMEFKQNGVIGHAAWDRMAASEILLKRISVEEVDQLFKARLHEFIHPYAALPEISVKLDYDPLFPLGREWFKQICEDRIDFRPREAINLAKERFGQEQAALRAIQSGVQWLKKWPSGGTSLGSTIMEPLIDATVEQKRQSQILRRELDDSGLPPDVYNLWGLVETLLLQCKPGCPHDYTLRDLEVLPEKKAGRRLPYHLLVEEARSGDGQKIITGLTFVVTGSKNSASWALKRILTDLEKGKQPPDHVILVTDAREPLRLGKAGEAHLLELEQRGEAVFKHLNLSFMQYVELDALQTVIGEARSGDLEVDLPGGCSQTLTEADVIASYHRQDRYRKHVLLQELLTEAPLPGSGKKLKETEVSEEQEIKAYIMAQLALTMGMSSLEVTNKFLHHKKLADEQREQYHEAIKAAAIAMDKAEKIHATPMGDQLSLMYRSS